MRPAHGMKIVDQSDRRTVILITVVLLITGVLFSPLSVLWRILLAEAVASVLLVLVLRRWKASLPFAGSPTYRLLAVAAALLVVLIVEGRIQPTPESLDLTFRTESVLDRVWAAAIGALAVPSAVFGELFFRGVLYSHLREWRGSLAAVLGTAAISVVLVLPLVGFQWGFLAIGFASSLLLAASRWHTGSVTPAVLAQGAHTAVGALFAILVAFS
jgi:membrane protease YdiL (CAAX protease family)